MAKTNKKAVEKQPDIKSIKHEKKCFAKYPERVTRECRTCKYHVDCKEASK